MRNFVPVVMLSVTCMSSAWADSRYVIQGGEVYDTRTKLTWARCSVGQEWKNEHCVGAVSTFTFVSAQKQASSGWRVPTKDELVTLIDPDRKSFPAIDMAAFPDMDANHPWYWSSTPNGTAIAWYVDFTDGYTSGFVDGINTLAIRLVRSDK
jgi:hypothetical protein